ncbi:MAG: Ig-like domain-containing protein [Prevotellaceae bacterium]|jgi:uncharacterized protein YjdB|nr:Ig-like domain-containing protein [Prevotellaceae bacterium]
MKKSRIFKGIILSAMICAASISCQKNKDHVNVPVTGIKLSKHNTSLVVGKKEVLLYNVLPANATNKKVTWKSKDTKIASVDATGSVTGVAEGTTVIIVTTVDKAKTDSCTVTVTKQTVAVTGVTVTPTTASVKAGESVQITATVAPAEATNKKVTWKSNDDKIATVDANGLVAGKAKGSAVVTATTEDGGKTATANITVTE